MTDLQVAVPATVERGVGKDMKSTRRKIGDQKDWTIKGLPAETVDVAREAASASGMKINAWIDKIINDSAALISLDEKIPINSENGRNYNLIEFEKLKNQNEDLVRAVTRLSALLAKSFDISD